MSSLLLVICCLIFEKKKEFKVFCWWHFFYFCWWHSFYPPQWMLNLPLKVKLDCLLKYKWPCLNVAGKERLKYMEILGIFPATKLSIVKSSAIWRRHGLYDIEILFQSLELKAVEATIVRWDFLDLKLQRVPEITLWWPRMSQPKGR